MHNGLLIRCLFFFILEVSSSTIYFYLQSQSHLVPDIIHSSTVLSDLLLNLDAVVITSAIKDRWMKFCRVVSACMGGIYFAIFAIACQLHIPLKLIKVSYSLIAQSPSCSYMVTCFAQTADMIQCFDIPYNFCWNWNVLILVLANMPDIINFI